MAAPGSGLHLQLEGEALEKRLIELATHWCSIDPFAPTREEIQKYIDSQDFGSLNKALVPRISFGTAGLRASMKAGYAFMNYVTVQQTSQGLAKHLQQAFGIEDCKRGVVVGYDARHNSKGYAETVAKVFRALEVPVLLFSRTVCTPLVPFTVRLKGYVAGVMITASHNPKQDNGYKIYWNDGAQLVDPHDKLVAKSILANLDLWNLPTELTGLEPDITDEVIASYVEASSRKYCRSRERNGSVAPIVYTPMHGVGYELLRATFESYNHPQPIVVPLQVVPDPEFPTVVFPNPEEGEGALKLAFETAEEAGVKLILANDPDADRLAVAELQPTGIWRVFTGDEVAFFFADWELSHFTGEKGLIVSSTVSSKLTKAIALAHGCRFEEVLVGFKWMIKKSLELLAEGWHTVLSYEEAIGYCIGDLVRDKDGVTAAAVFVELYTSRCINSGISLTQHLENLYRRYGYYLTKNKYFFCYDPSTIKRVFNALRSKYPTHLGEFAVLSVRDLTVGYDSAQPDHKPVLPVSASSEMITFTLANEGIVTLRTSGTEPKIKYYCEYHGSSWESASSTLDRIVESVIREWLQPETYGLIWAPS